MYRIGCDVGGTNTDAAILDVHHSTGEFKEVLATCKTPTTSHVADGIRKAVAEVLKKLGIDRQKVLNVAIGTTHFVNAVIEGDATRLNKVACIRLCGPYTRAVCWSGTDCCCGTDKYRTLLSPTFPTLSATLSKDHTST